MAPGPGPLVLGTDLSFWHRYVDFDDPDDTCVPKEFRTHANVPCSPCRTFEPGIELGTCRFMGQYAVAKRINRAVLDWGRENRETNDRIAHFSKDRRRPMVEDAFTEIGILTYLKKQADPPIFLQKMLTARLDGDYIMLVTENLHAGSLSQQVKLGLDMPENRIRRFMSQILKALNFLHGHRVGHRCISLENIFVTFERDAVGDIRLSNFGGAALTHSQNTGAVLRYFSLAGKSHYRAPEMYVPAEPELHIFLDSVPTEVIAARVNFMAIHEHLIDVLLPPAPLPRICQVEPVGYELLPADVFAAGVSLCILALHAAPWQEATLADLNFREIYRRGFRGAICNGQDFMISTDLVDLLEAMMLPNPPQRPSAAQCLQHRWFTPEGISHTLHRSTTQQKSRSESSKNLTAKQGPGSDTPQVEYFDMNDNLLARLLPTDSCQTNRESFDINSDIDDEPPEDLTEAVRPKFVHCGDHQPRVPTLKLQFDKEINGLPESSSTSTMSVMEPEPEQSEQEIVIQALLARQAAILEKEELFKSEKGKREDEMQRRWVERIKKVTGDAEESPANHVHRDNAERSVQPQSAETDACAGNLATEQAIFTPTSEDGGAATTTLVNSTLSLPPMAVIVSTPPKDHHAHDQVGLWWELLDEPGRLTIGGEALNLSQVSPGDDDEDINVLAAQEALRRARAQVAMAEERLRKTKTQLQTGGSLRSSSASRASSASRSLTPERHLHGATEQ